MTRARYTHRDIHQSVSARSCCGARLLLHSAVAVVVVVVYIYMYSAGAGGGRDEGAVSPAVAAAGRPQEEESAACQVRA